MGEQGLSLDAVNGEGGGGPGHLVRRRGAPVLSTTSDSPRSAHSTPCSKRNSIKSTIESLVRRQSIESAASTGSQADYFQPEQTIIIFDWDDTICPSTWIQANRFIFTQSVPSEECLHGPLRELQTHAEALLQQARQLGSVVIITNATEPWVETSCTNFLPELVPVVSTLPIVYARSSFNAWLESVLSANGDGSAASTPRPASENLEHTVAEGANEQPLDDSAPLRWKEVAFEKEIAGFYSRYEHQSWKNVVSIGDSVFERDATQQVVMSRSCTKKPCRAKTVKMFDDPSIEELVAQVCLINEMLGALVQYDGDLNMEIDMGDLQEAGYLEPDESESAAASP